MLKNKNRILIFAMVVLLVLSLIGSASWMIVKRLSDNATNGKAEQNDYFTTSVEYKTGVYQFPTPVEGNPYKFNTNPGNRLNVDQELPYEKDGEYHYKWVFEEYTVEWVDGYYPYKDENGNKVKIQTVSDFASAAGFHYYKITDNKTGQVISESHEMKITVPMSLVDNTPPATDRTVYYEGEQPKFTATITTNGLGGTKYEFDVTLIGEPLVFANGDPSAEPTSKVYTVNVKSAYCNEESENKDIYDPEIYTFDVINKVSLTVRAVAYTASGHEATTGTYYGTIKDAIDKANDPDQKNNQKYVYVSETYSNYTANVAKNGTVDEYKQIPALTIKGDVIINKGVTLVLPCATVSGDKDDDKTGQTTDYKYVKTLTSGTGTRVDAYWSTMKSVKTYLYSNISIGESASLTNNGTVLIGGVVSGGGGGAALSGFTSEWYGQITLYDNAELVNNSMIECYGYIDDESKEKNKSKITSVLGSTLISPFCVEEHRGGTTFSEMAGGIMGVMANGVQFQATPFNRFYMPNVVPTNEMQRGAIVTGYADLYANSKPNVTLISIVGTSKTSLIRLTNSSSKLVAKYDPEDRITYLDTFGDVSLNPLTLNLTIEYSVFTVPMSISTADVFFALNWHFKITLHEYESGKNATVTFNQDVKVLPGASLTVGLGVTLKAKKLVVYDEYGTTWTDELLDSPTYYNQCYDYDFSSKTYKAIDNDDISAGELIVNGALYCTSLAGEIHSTAAGAVIAISDDTSIDLNEIKNNNGSADVKQVHFELSLKGIKSSSSGAYMTTEKETDDDDIYYPWKNVTNEDFNINLYYVYDDKVSEKPSDIIPFKYSDSSFTLDVLDETDGYKFVGWFTDEACTKPITEFDPKLYVGDTNLYAGFTKGKIYTISFDINLPTGAVIPDEVKNNDIWNSKLKFMLSSLSAFDPKLYDVTDTMLEFWQQIDVSVCFNGWYLDKDGKDAFSEENLLKFVDEGNENITLYANWSNKLTFTIKNTASADAEVAVAGVKYIIKNGGTNNTFYIKEGDTIEGMISASHSKTQLSFSTATATAKVTVKMGESVLAEESQSESSKYIATATANVACQFIAEASATFTIEGN